MDHVRLLKRLSACDDAVAWCRKYKSLANCWRYCDRADWLLWFAARIGVDRKLIALAACGCAETSLQYIQNIRYREKAETAINTVRKWAADKATIGEVRSSAAAAAAAGAGAAAAYADAYAAAAYAVAVAAADAYAYACAVAAADAAADAADADAYAAAAAAAADAAAYAAAAAAAAAADAYAAADADATAAKKKSLSAMCIIVRKYISWEQIKKEKKLNK